MRENWFNSHNRFSALPREEGGTEEEDSEELSDDDDEEVENTHVINNRDEDAWDTFGSVVEPNERITGVTVELRLATANVRGLGNGTDGMRPSKLLKIHKFLTENNCDFLAITETHLRPGEEQDMTPDIAQHYTALGRARRCHDNVKPSGGTMALCKKKFRATMVETESDSDTDEYFFAQLLIGNEKMFVGVVYWPPVGSLFRDEETLDRILTTAVKLQAQGRVVMLGDFNARVGNTSNVHTTGEDEFGLAVTVEVPRRSQDRTSSREGKILINSMNDVGFSIKNGSTRRGQTVAMMSDAEQGPLTYYHANTGGISAVDLLIVENNDLDKCSAVIAHKMIGEDNFCPDHYVISSTMTFQYKQPPPTPVLNVHPSRQVMVKCKRPPSTREGREAFSEEVKKRINELKGVSEMSASQHASVLTSILQDVLGQQPAKRQQHEQRLTTKLKALRAEKTRTYEAFKRAHPGTSPAELETRKNHFKQATSTYLRALEVWSRDVRAAHLKWMKVKLLTSPRTFWRRVKLDCAWKLVAASLRSKVTTPEVCLNNWKTYFQESFDAAASDPSLRRLSAPPAQQITNPAHVGLNEPITLQEVQTAVSMLNSQSAPGADGIDSKTISAAGLCMAQQATAIFNKVWASKQVPEEWCRAIIKPLCKTGKRAQDDAGEPIMENHRPISLLDCQGKLFCTVLKNRIQAVCNRENLIADEQGGFRHGRGTPEVLFTFCEAVKAARLKSLNYSKVWVAFLDVEKAYDSVYRQGLWDKMTAMGIHGTILEVINNMYDQAESSVLIDELISEKFGSSRGVRQGCVLSPILFSIFINGLIDDIKASNLGVQMTDSDGAVRPLGALLFADDIALMATSKQELQRLLDIVAAYFTKWKLKLNLEKSQIMIMNPNNRGAADSTTKLRYGHGLEARELEYTKEVRYLGVMINPNLTWGATRAKAVKGAYANMWKISKLLSGPMQISIPLAVMTYKSMIRPCLEYCQEIIHDGNNSWPEADRVQNRFLRMLLRVRQSTRTLTVLSELGMSSLESRREKAKLRFLGAMAVKAYDNKQNPQPPGRMMSYAGLVFDEWNRTMSAQRLPGITRSIASSESSACTNAKKVCFVSVCREILLSLKVMSANALTKQWIERIRLGMMNETWDKTIDALTCIRNRAEHLTLRANSTLDEASMHRRLEQAEIRCCSNDALVQIRQSMYTDKWKFGKVATYLEDADLQPLERKGRETITRLRLGTHSLKSVTGSWALARDHLEMKVAFSTEEQAARERGERAVVRTQMTLLHKAALKKGPVIRPSDWECEYCWTEGHGHRLESDVHFICECPQFASARQTLFSEVAVEVEHVTSQQLGMMTAVNRYSTLIGRGMIDPVFSVDFRSSVKRFVAKCVWRRGDDWV